MAQGVGLDHHVDMLVVETMLTVLRKIRLRHLWYPHQNTLQIPIHKEIPGK